MDNIATQLQQLATIKQDLANVISTYGDEVPGGFYNYAETFSTLLKNAGGSGSETLQLRLSDYPDLRFGYSTFTSVPNYIIIDTLPDQIFTNCVNLTSVTIPNSVTSIGNYAFYNCSGLPSVTIPSSVTTIGASAFYGCSGLTSVTIPSSVTSIGNTAFAGCSGLTSVTIPSSVTSIGYSAFAGCSGLTSVTIPSSVTSIGNNAFAGCSGLTSVTIPSSVTTIGYSAFSYCSELTSVSIPGNMYLFGRIDDPNNGSTLQSSVFSGTGITSLTIPGQIKQIPDSISSGCQSLASLTIEEGIELIGSYAFGECSSLTSATIPSTVQYLQDSAFSYCSNLTWIKCLPLTPPETWENGSSISAFEETNNCPIYVPDAAVSAYKSSTSWQTYWDRIKPMSDFDTDFPQTQTRTLTNKLYDRSQNEYQNAENSSDPITNLNNGSCLLRVVDNNGVYLTDNDITPGDMMGYTSPSYDGEEHGWWISLFNPNWTAADFKEAGIDLSGSIPIEYEYYDPDTGDPINQENQAIIYYDFTGLQ